MLLVLDLIIICSLGERQVLKSVLMNMQHFLILKKPFS